MTTMTMTMMTRTTRKRECYATTCPECEEEIFFDDTMLEDGEIICPNCGAKLEFDLSDLADAADEDKDEE